MLKDIFKKMAFYVPVSAVIVLTWLAISFVSAWTSPAGSPPGSNAPAPLNVSSTAQTKSGSLTVSDFYLSDGVQVQGLSGRNYFRDIEGAANLRVGAVWGMPGVYAESGRVVIGGADGVSFQNNSAYLESSGRFIFSGPANICTKIYYGEGGPVSCPANYYVTSAVDGSGNYWGSLPSSGYMICCKNAD